MITSACLLLIADFKPLEFMFFTDQTGNTIRLADAPKRIVSVVPSQTELLFDLGLEQEVIGITKFCVHPPSWFKTKQKVGGTKNLRIKTIHALIPDLIIANKEENTREEVEELQQSFPVWTSDVKCLEDALEMIAGIGMITRSSNKADVIIQSIRSRFSDLANNLVNPVTGERSARSTASVPPQTAYLIWREPYMAAGEDTFIHDMMLKCGFDNVFKNVLRYPVITIPQLADAHFEVLLLSSEPYPFSDKHLKEFSEAFPFAKVILVDGQMFSWYGSRLLYAPGYFKSLMEQVKAL